MDDWKSKLRNSEFNKGGGKEMKKTCKICKEPLRDDKYDTCYKCSKKNKEASDSLPSEYISKLEEGYFDSKGHLREELITTMASEVALKININKYEKKLTNHQLRRFYGHAKAALTRLKMTDEWESVNLDVKKLAPFVSEAKGKKKIPQNFYDFMDRNIKAIKTQKDFVEGFMEHFQAVLAYFTYYNPKD